MNDLEILQQVHVDVAASERAIAASREALVAEIDRPQLPRRRFGLMVVSVGAACVAGAAGTAIVTRPHRTEQGLTLVDFQIPTFPYSFSREVDGMHPTSFEQSGAETTADGQGAPVMSALYGPGSDPNYPFDSEHRRVTLIVAQAPSVPIEDMRETSVDGSPTRVWSLLAPGSTEAQLWWQDQDQWVGLMGMGPYASEEKLRELASLVVERPQPIPVRMQRAPAGWKLVRFATSVFFTSKAPSDQALRHNIDRLLFVDPKNPRRRLSVAHMGMDPVEHPASDSDRWFDETHSVTVRGRLYRATHVTRDGGYNYWMLRARSGDRASYAIEATPDLTAQQVSQIAESVVWE